ncbi:alpha/beta-hydrolase [Hypoxylon sp. FL1284]|nr:alpha/beta-hydrolase [Hypoxylon sp. FL1284]
MKPLLLLSRIILGIAAARHSWAISSTPELSVKTLTGVYTGQQSPDYPDVREFRNIPYAEPPVGKLRWKAPVPLRPSRKHHYSYRFPASCPQYMTSNLTVWNSNITNFGIELGDQSRNPGEIAQTSAEDCLSLAIWTPINATSQDKLPVGLFIPGGSFKTGGLDSPYYKPVGWVNRTQSHIMVTMNYRVNIFGFPNAAGLDDQNLGILDQRLALEWLYANVEGFGGDPDRITVWGHSAGGVSADVLNFAYHDEPLAAGFYLMSGTAARTFSQGDNALQNNFTYVAKELGCDFEDDPVAEVECMREVPASLITNFIGHYADDKKKPSLFFRPTVDFKVIFENYTERAELGLLSKAPALVTLTANEKSSLIKYPVDNLIGGPNKTEVDEGTLEEFVCPAFNSTNERAMNNLTTYRYQYAGNYSNLTPLSWMGAYHGADIPLIFGSYNISGNATDLERQAAETMQDYVLAFLEDAENGLRNLGYLPCGSAQEGDQPMVRFSAGVNIVENITSAEVDDACLGEGSYDSDPIR